MKAPTADALNAIRNVVADECVEWTGVRMVNGYGQASAGRKGKVTTAHRRIYTLLVADIPDGMHLDHLCRNKLCVRPDHLEPVTNVENQRRRRIAIFGHDTSEVCAHGHPRAEHSGRRADGRLYCRECNRIYVAVRKQVAA